MGGFQGLLPGSVSKYCLQHSPVPVIVVRPSSKRNKARNKRALDPNRHAYKDLLEKSGNLIDTDPRTLNTDDSRQASEDEAAAVAAAIGYKRVGRRSPLIKSTTIPSYLDSNVMDQDLRSPGVVMKSPDLQNLDSPDITDSSSSEDEEDVGGISTNASAEDLDAGEPNPGLDGKNAEDVNKSEPELQEASSTIPEVVSEEGIASKIGDGKDEVELKLEQEETSKAAET